MRRQWIVALFVLALAVAMAPQAWADCKNQMVLTPGPGTATGTAEKKVAAATLKTPAANKFEVDVQLAGSNIPYLVMITSGTPAGQFTTVGGFFTNSSGVGEFDIKNAAGTCDVHRVRVVSLTGTTMLSGNFDTAPMNDDLPEVQIENEMEVQAQVEAELNNIAAEVQREVEARLNNIANP